MLVIDTALIVNPRVEVAKKKGGDTVFFFLIYNPECVFLHFESFLISFRTFIRQPKHSFNR